jgi:predicted metal-binding protein
MGYQNKTNYRVVQAIMDRKKIEEKFLEYNFTDFKWINPKKFVTGQWVRMKCMFGCNEYGNTAICPPNVPSVSECERFFQEYKEAIIFHFQKKVDKPEDRFAWTRKVNLKLLKLEKEIFTSGYQKAFLLFLDSCNICEECPGIKEECKEPKMARPTPEAMCVDVYSTVRQVGYPIHVLSEYTQAMNRYAFLLIE